MNKPFSLSTLRITKNVTGLFILQVSVKAISVVWTIYLARRMGVNLYGVWANILALVAILGTLQGFGILSVVVKEVSQSHQKDKSYFGAAILIYGLSSLLSFSLILVTAWFLNDDRAMTLALFFAGMSFLLSAPGLASQSILHGHEQFLFHGIVTNLGLLVYMIGGLLAIELGFGITGLFVVLGISYGIASLILSFSTVRKYGKPIMTNSMTLGTQLVRMGIPLMCSVLMLETILRADRLLINHFLGEAAVGYYQAAFNLIYLPRELILLPIGTAVYTQLCSSYSQDRGFFEKFFEKMNILMLLITLLIAGLFISFPEQLTVTFYGNAYRESSKILPVIVWLLPPLFLCTFWQNILIIQNRTKMIFWCNFMGAMISLITNFLFLPIFGILVAAITAVSTQFLIMGFLFWLLREERLFSFFKRLPRILFAFSIATAVTWLLKPAAVANPLLSVLMILSGAVIYLLIFFIFRVVNEDEILLIKTQLQEITRIARNASPFKQS